MSSTTGIGLLKSEELARLSKDLLGESKEEPYWWLLLSEAEEHINRRFPMERAEARKRRWTRSAVDQKSTSDDGWSVEKHGMTTDWFYAKWPSGVMLQTGDCQTHYWHRIEHAEAFIDQEFPLEGES